MTKSTRNHAQSFAILLESILMEASQVLDLFPENHLFQEFVKTLHQRKMLSHQSVPDIRITSNQVKQLLTMLIEGKHYGLYILVGSENIAAILSSASKDTAIFLKNGKLVKQLLSLDYWSRKKRTVANPANLEIVNSLGLGNIETILYFKSPKTYITRMRRVRREQRAPETSKMTERQAVSVLLKKFKPILMKNLVKARADLQGYLMIRTKNSPANLFTKLGALKQLIDDIESIELGISDFEDSDTVRTALSNSIVMSAAYLYPDQVDNIYHRYGELNITGNAVTSLLKDLSSGGNQIIGVILGFFRKELMRPER